METLAQFADHTARIDDLTALWRLSLDFFHGRGIARVSYHAPGLFADTPASWHATDVVADNFPEDWVCAYVEERLYTVDPIPAFAASHGRPFLWSEIGKLVELDAAQKAFLKRLEGAGLGDGLAVPVFGPFMRNGYVGLGFGGPRPELTSAQIVELQAAAQIAHLRACAIADAAPRAGALTARETEVLEWVARGKSNAAIATILGVSPHTVDTLVRRIFAKLGTTDRTTAALRGLGAGLVQV